MNLGAAIMARRLKLGWSRVQLAKRVGISDSAVGAIEIGVRDPRWQTLLDIAEALDITVSVLVADAEQLPDANFDPPIRPSAT